MKYKFKKNDIAYTIFASFDNGKKHFYEKVIIDNALRNNNYSFIHSDGSICSSCPQQFLLTKNELEKELKKGSKLVR